MNKNFSFDHWRNRLHTCRDFVNDAHCDEFLELLKIAEQNMSYEVAVELLGSFSDEDDFGLHERTRNVLEAADRHIFYPALAHELGVVLARAPQHEWAITLVGIELEYGNFNLLMDYVSKLPETEKRIFLSLLNSDEFIDNYPNVLQYLL